MLGAALTPGAYLRHRRTAAGMSIADVAATLSTVPRIAEHARVEWIERIEADVQPATLNTIVALRCAFQFDLDVLGQLATIALGAEIPPPRLCRLCACSDHDACPGGCGWVAPDLCSFCTGLPIVHTKPIAEAA